MDTVLQQWETEFFSIEEAAAKAAKGVRDLFWRMAQELADAHQWRIRAEKAEEALALYESQSGQELGLRELYEEEIQKLQRMPEGTEAKMFQDDILELQLRLRQIEEDRDHNYERLHQELEIRELYETQILKVRDLAWDRGEELEKLECKLKEEADIRSKLECEVVELTQSLIRVQDEKTALAATDHAQTNTSENLQKEVMESRNTMVLLQNGVGRRYTGADDKDLSVMCAKSTTQAMYHGGQPSALETPGTVGKIDDPLKHEDDSHDEKTASAATRTAQTNTAENFQKEVIELCNIIKMLEVDAGSRRPAWDSKEPNVMCAISTTQAMHHGGQPSASKLLKTIDEIYDPLEHDGNFQDEKTSSAATFNAQTNNAENLQEDVLELGSIMKLLQEDVGVRYPAGADKERNVMRAKIIAQAMPLGCQPSALERLESADTLEHKGDSQDEKSALAAALNTQMNTPDKLQDEVLDLGNTIRLLQKDVGDRYPAGDGKEVNVMRADCAAQVMGHGGQPSALEPLECVGRVEDLLEHKDSSTWCLDTPEILGRGPAAINGYGSPDMMIKNLVPPTSEKSIQVTCTELEEKDLLIQHLDLLIQLNLEAALKELEVSKSVHGLVV